IQFLNPDGSVDLETNGRPVTLAVNGTQQEPSAVVTPDDRIAIVWEDARGNSPKIYAQLISATGERMWGDGGMEITDIDPLRQKDARVSFNLGDDSFYLGWSESVQVESNFFYHVYGQRIYNNQKMWGVNGRLISVLPTGSENSECTLYGLNDSYYMWHRSSSDNTQTIWVKRVDSNGDAFAGWDIEGVKASTYNDWDTFQILPVAHQTPSGLFVMWKDLRGDFIPNYWGQHFGPSGVREWDPIGVNLADRQNEQERPVITSSMSGVTFAWCENLNGVHDIAIQKYSLSGLPQWGNLGYYVVQKDSTQSNPTMVKFNNGAQIVAWTDFYNIESDIYYKYVNEDGTMIGAPLGSVLTNASKPQYDPLAATLNNEAYVVWADGRSSGKTEILGLYAQKLNNPVANDDPTAPPVGGITLDQNYPNPFNPNTKISFSLAQAANGLKLQIFNLRGQLVKELLSSDLPAGKHSYDWDGRDNSGNGVASGMYFYKLSGDNVSMQKKMILMK
nr:T9SS type A sorting domain-containing protein [Candidatus Cloacimonadota bacterium]